MEVVEIMDEDQPMDGGEEYDSEKEGSRPIKEIWPEDSLLKPDHFTIDHQNCLKCGKDLGYAMPMNKKPNVSFLYCRNEDGSDLCRASLSYLPCHYCGNYNNENTGSLVSRPGNSSYYGPSQIYQFMCYHCHKEMMDNEPGLEECREQMSKIRELRKEEELKDKGRSFLTTKGGLIGAPTEVFNSFFESSIQKPQTSKKRKIIDRVYNGKEEKEPEEEGMAE